jgi:predicted flap endonuclease-1-like 5' DNA nuclease
LLNFCDNVNTIKIIYKITTMTNNSLLILIIILTILTIIHIAYYLLQLTKVPKLQTNGNNKANLKLTNNFETKTLPVNKAPKADDSNVFYTQSDNFQKVEGIGPAIEETLKTAGIRTYKQLSEADYSTLKSILMSKGSKFVMHDPRNWPKQAKLALEGKWDELEKLKIELIRGK